MKAKVKRNLVIDASVLQGAGGSQATHPTSQHCRDLLAAIFNMCHRAVLTQQIKEEWDNHPTETGVRWRGDMQRHSKIILFTHLPSYESILQRINTVTHDTGQQQVMQKDFRLITAALSHDRLVISLDDTARGLFSRAADNIDELRPIMWVHPDEPDLISWLEEGAMLDTRRCLGYRAGEPL